MKTRIVILIGLLLLNCSISICNQAATGNNPSQSGSINVLTTPELYNLTMDWTNEYGKLNPALKINVIKSTDNSFAGMLGTGTGIGFVSSGSYAALNKQSTWNMVVGRDVIVPVMNAGNPILKEINHTGITSEGLKRLVENPGNQDWGVLLGNSQKTPVNYYMLDDASVKSDLEHFMNTPGVIKNGITVKTSHEMIAAIKKDPYAIGFCRLVDLINPENQRLTDYISLVPIDKNGNGKIDYMEDIYSSLPAFSRGVWIGKYPKALSDNIYSVSSANPKTESELAFLTWVITDGQQLLGTNGYCDLVSGERQTQLDKLNNTAIYVAAPVTDSFAIVKVVLLVLIAFAVIGLFFDLAVRRFRNNKSTINDSTSILPALFDENSVIAPKGLYFDKTHTWAFMQQDGKVKIGIDDFLQHITGPLSRIGMKPAGVKVKKGDPLLTIIQKGKHLAIYAPVSGTITAYNKALLTDSSPLNAAPYTDGWVYMIEPTNWLREIEFLSMSEKYRIWLKEEFSRLKDFFANAIQANSPGFATIALQDGGALKDSIMADLGPEVWEDFQTNFLDRSR